MAATAPDCSIDYDRWYSLPCGVPPAGLAAADLATYFSALDLAADRFFCARAGGSSFDPLLWDISAASPDLIRFRTIAGGGTTLVVPRSSHIAGTTDASLKPAAFETAVAPWSTPATLAAGDTGDTLTQKTMAVLPWTKEARSAGDWPMPLVPDESVPLWWLAPGPDTTGTAPQGAATVGVLQLDGSVNPGGTPTHLLESTANSWSGEYSPLLLRAPAFGQVRFQRYRHVAQSGATVSLSHPSAAGRLVLRVPPRSAGIPDASVAHPADATTVVVIDHVTVASAVQYLGALLTFQVTHFTDFTSGALVGRADSAQVLRALFTELLRTWIAVAPGLPSPEPVNDVAYKPFIPPSAGPPPVRTIAEIKTAVDFVNADAARQTAFIAFVRTMYVPVLCGMPVMDGALAPVARSASTALLCYAGCPLGEPAPAYATAAATVDEPNDALTNAFTTFDVEAMHILGLAKTALGVATVTSPAPAEAFKDVPLGDFTGSIVGKLAVARCAEPRSPTPEYGRLTPVTFTEHLRSAALGVTRVKFVPPTFDLTTFAAGTTPVDQHPLLDVIGWESSQEAMARRAVMDQASAAKIGAKSVPRATIDWWSTRTGLLDAAGTWPVRPISGPTRVAPTPRVPYLPASSSAQFSNGYDIFDLEAAALAQAAVRDGKTLGTVPLALFLALLRAESYAEVTINHRAGEPQTIVAGGKQALPPNDPLWRRLVRSLARSTWLVKPFSVDEMNHDKTPNALTVSGQLQSMDDEFDAVLKTLATPRASTIAGIADDSIIDTSVLPTALVRDYLEDALETLWSGSDLQTRVLSRRTQWIGMAIQMALFQWKQRCMHDNVRDPYAENAAFAAVPELQAADVPPIGSDANSAERCAFVSYYAAIYIGFNAGPFAFNLWVAAAQAEITRRTSAGHGADTVTRMITLFRNPAGQPDALLPALSPGVTDSRILGQRGNMLRFAAGLDMYARLDDSTAGNQPPDLVDPALRDAAGNSNWKLAGE